MLETMLATPVGEPRDRSVVVDHVLHGAASTSTGAIWSSAPEDGLAARRYPCSAAGRCAHENHDIACKNLMACGHAGEECGLIILAQVITAPSSKRGSTSRVTVCSSPPVSRS